MMNRSQRDKAVAIAKDVLLQIKAENSYKMTQGVYFQSVVDIDSLDGDVQDNFDVIAPDCQVCMLGAVMLSKAKLFDAVSVGSGLNGRYTLRTLLSDIFDDATLDCLESAFEGDDSFADGGVTDSVRGAVMFGLSYSSSPERAGAIAQNLIDNDGLLVFDPVSEEDYNPFPHDQDDDEDDYHDYHDYHDDEDDEDDE